jgi:hypothetical protein
MDIDALTHSTDARTAAKALADAAATAGYAPSIHNTQPWRWRLTGNTLDLHLVRSRIRRTSDTDGRLATLSCGAALHHARIAMAAHGWQITVARMLQGADRDLIARLHVGHRAPVDPTSATLLRAVPSRHTDRRAVADPPFDPQTLAAVTAAIEAQGARQLTLRPDQVVVLGAAAGHAQRSQTPDSAWQAELTYWTGLVRPVPTRTTVPGQHSDSPITARHDTAAVFVMLYGGTDEPLDWLRAGEALSAGWLTATGHEVSVLPHSAPIETVATREAMRAMIAGTGFPYLVLRLGAVDPADAALPRRPADQIIERY